MQKKLLAVAVQAAVRQVAVPPEVAVRAVSFTAPKVAPLAVERPKLSDGSFPITKEAR